MGKVLDFYTKKETSKLQLEEENEFFREVMQEVLAGLTVEEAEHLKKAGYNTLTAEQRMVLRSIKAAKKILK